MEPAVGSQHDPCFSAQTRRYLLPRNESASRVLHSVGHGPRAAISSTLRACSLKGWRLVGQLVTSNRFSCALVARGTFWYFSVSLLCAPKIAQCKMTRKAVCF